MDPNIEETRVKAALCIVPNYDARGDHGKQNLSTYNNFKREVPDCFKAYTREGWLKIYAAALSIYLNKYSLLYSSPTPILKTNLISVLTCYYSA